MQRSLHFGRDDKEGSWLDRVVEVGMMAMEVGWAKKMVGIVGVKPLKTLSHPLSS